MSEQEKVDEWNAKYLPGQVVELRLNGGQTFKNIKTSSPAQLMGGQAIIWIDGGAGGGYPLDRVKAQS